MSPLLTTAEAAVLAGGTAKTLGKWVAAGALVLAGRTPGGNMRFRASDEQAALVRVDEARRAESGLALALARLRAPEGGNATGGGWTVQVVPGRAGAGERGLFLRARRRRAGGKSEERRAPAGTDDPATAERLRVAVEESLNPPELVVPGLLEVLEAREDELRRRSASGRSKAADDYRATLLALATVLPDRFVPARAPLLHARDELAASGRWLPDVVNMFMRRAAAAWRWALKRELVEGDWPVIKRLDPGPVRLHPSTPHEFAALVAWLCDNAG